MNKEDPSLKRLQQLPTSDTLQSSLDVSELATTAPQNSALATINSQTTLNNGINSNLLPGMNSSLGQNGLGSTSAMGNSLYGNSMYGNSGMYGGSSMYGGGSMYGSSMYGGGMGMGMGGMGMGGMNPPVIGQPGQFRDEYQGVLMGFNSLMNIMGAAVGMVSFGGTFVHYTKNAIVYVAKGFTNIAYRILGIAFMKRVIRWLMSSEVQRDLLKSMHRVAHAEKAGLGKKIMRKLFLVVRVLSGLACLGMYFMHHRLTKKMREIERNNQNIRNFDNTIGPIMFDNEVVIEEKKEMEDSVEDTGIVDMNLEEAKVEEVEEQMNGLKDEQDEDKKSQIESADNLDDNQEDNDQISIKLDAERTEIDVNEQTEVDNAKGTQEQDNLEATTEAVAEEDIEQKQINSEIVAKEEGEINQIEAKTEEETVEVAPKEEETTLEVAPKEEETATLEVIAMKEEEKKEMDAAESSETKDDKVVAASSEEQTSAVKTLDEAFDNVMSQNNTYVQSNQVRSEEFWKHEQPQSPESTQTVLPTSTANIVEETITPAVQVSPQQPALVGLENEIIPSNTSAAPQLPQYNFFSGQSYPQTDLNLQTPPFEFQNQSLLSSQPSVISAAVEQNNLSNPFSASTSSTAFSGDMQQPKIFKAVTNRAKPWLK